MVSLIFVSAFETMLEIKCTKSVITFFCQTENILVIVVARGLGPGVGVREMGSDC